MTEVERLRDQALVVLLAHASDYALAHGETLKSDAVADLATRLRDASATQDDEDRNGARRAMGKADCAKAEVVIACNDQSADACKACRETCSARITAETEDGDSAAIPDDGGEEFAACGEQNCDECHDADCNGRR